MSDPFQEIMARSYRFTVGWGTGNYFRQSVAPEDRSMLAFLVDSDKSKWGGSLEGLQVHAPDKLRELDPGETLVLVFSSFYDEVLPGIRSRGHHHVMPGRVWNQYRLHRAQEELREAIEAGASSEALAVLQHRLAGLWRRGDIRWQEMDALEKAVAGDPRNPDWHRELAEACDKMNRHDRAAEAYAQAIDRTPSPPVEWRYRRALSLERAGRQQEADAALEDAVARHPSPVAKSLGAGFFHYRSGHYALAAQVWERMPDDDVHSPFRDFRRGKAYERLFEWGKALQAYHRALGASSPPAGCLFRTGFICERLGRWEEAADAYRRALTPAGRCRPSWAYRLGVVLSRAGCQEAACEAFVRSTAATVPPPPRSPRGTVAEIRAQLEKDALLADSWQALGEACEAEHDGAGAVHAFAEFLARDGAQHSTGFHRLACARMKLGDFEGACRAWERMRPMGRPSLRPIRRRPDVSTLYNEYRETQPLDETTVLYECFFGRSMTCNPYALFRHLLGRPEFAGWRHVWVLGDASKVPEDIRAMPHVVVVQRESPLYLRYLATAGYLVNNVTFPPYFSRREGQRYLNTWHGTPLKTLGLDVRGADPFDHKNVARNFLHVTHLCSPNPHTSDALTRPYHVAGLMSGRLAETGYPRIDLTLNTPKARREALRARLGVEAGQPVVLYAPTWRGDQGREGCNPERLRDEIDCLSKLPCRCLFRGHHFMEKQLASLDFNALVVPADIDTNELLSIVDLLVTDYSSVFFDYLPTGRPVVFYVHDLEEYADVRGLYFDMDEMPGPKCRTLDELGTTIRSLLQAGLPPPDDPLRRTALSRFCPREDGRAAERVANWFFLDAPMPEVASSGKPEPSVLFYTIPFLPNGITTSALNLLGALSRIPVRLHLAVDPSGISTDPERRRQFAELPSSVQVLGRVGTANQSPEEEWVARRLSDRYTLESPAQWRVYAAQVEREFIRMFGAAHFDALIDFAGYSIFWASLFAFAPSASPRRVIYMHNDMDEECRRKYPYLEILFQLYSHFDAIAAVSPSVCQSQRRILGPRYGVPGHRFVTCANVLAPAKVLERSQEPIDVPMRAAEEQGKTHFLVVGRMSPEKGHDKMLRAFARVHAQHPRTALWCLGDGPLRASIEDRIREMDLGRSVHLLGLVPNPFPCLKASDCLVMPSDHEGQPLILLEAMTLGKPILATDIDGVNALLREHAYGRLVENSEDGLVQGMLAFIEKGMDLPAFDVDKYQRSALDDFRRKVLGRPGK